jgi:hypothetical protein
VVVETLEVVVVGAVSEEAEEEEGVGAVVEVVTMVMRMLDHLKKSSNWATLCILVRMISSLRLLMKRFHTSMLHCILKTSNRLAKLTRFLAKFETFLSP